MNVGFFLIPIGIALVILGYRVLSRSGIIGMYVPADKISDLPMGVPVVIKGIIAVAQPLIAPYSQKPCVYYHSELQQKIEEKNQQGQTQLVWKPVGKAEEQRIPFFLQDASGQIMIRPDNSQIEPSETIEKMVTPGTLAQPPGNSSLLGQVVANIGSIQQRVNEAILAVGITINVFGVISMQGNDKFFQTTDRFPMIITSKSKEQLLSSEKGKAYICFIVAGVIILLGGYFLLHGK